MLLPKAAPQAVPQSCSPKLLSKAAPKSCSRSCLKLLPTAASQSCLLKLLPKTTVLQSNCSSSCCNAAKLLPTVVPQSCSPKLLPKAASQRSSPKQRAHAKEASTLCVCGRKRVQQAGSPAEVRVRKSTGTIAQLGKQGQ